jgi:hypothetical protein
MKAPIWTLALAVLTVARMTTAQPAGPFQDRLVQAPHLASPQRASVAGTFSGATFEAAEVTRGGFSLALPVTVPEERGTPRTALLPRYSVDQGLSEWGAGWAVPLDVRRIRSLGEINFIDDDLASPWGVLKRGTDGAFYPAGGDKTTRVVLEGNGLSAITGDGTRYRFFPTDAVVTPHGVYAWFLSEVQDVHGERTELTYERNSSGRPFLTRARYGGRSSSPAQYEIEYAYQPLPLKLADYRAGVRQVLDRRVSEFRIKAFASATGTYELRSRHVIHHTSGALGPAFYLTQLETQYRSGAEAPLVRYVYDQSVEWLSAGAFESVPGLDAYLTFAGPGGLLPSQATAFDADADGLTDLEHGRKNVLLRQTEPGTFVFEPLPEPTGSENPWCRRPESVANPPRLLARTEPQSDTPRVVAVSAVGSSTQVDTCDRAGKHAFYGVLSGGFRTFGPHPAGRFESRRSTGPAARFPRRLRGGGPNCRWVDETAGLRGPVPDPFGRARLCVASRHER